MVPSSRFAGATSAVMARGTQGWPSQLVQAVGRCGGAAVQRHKRPIGRISPPLQVQCSASPPGSSSDDNHKAANNILSLSTSDSGSRLGTKRLEHLPSLRQRFADARSCSEVLDLVVMAGRVTAAEVSLAAQRMGDLHVADMARPECTALLKCNREAFSALLRAATVRLPGLGFQGFSLLLFAAAQLEARPSVAQQAAWERQVADQLLICMAPPDLHTVDRVLYAYSRLKMKPLTGAFAQALCGCLLGQLPAWRQLAQRRQLDAAAQAVLQRALLRCLPSMSPQQVTLSLLAACQLGWELNDVARRTLRDAVERYRPFMTPQQEQESQAALDTLLDLAAKRRCC